MPFYFEELNPVYFFQDSQVGFLSPQYKNMKASIVYHSGFGHTQVVAEKIAEGLKKGSVEVALLTAETAMNNISALHESDILIFGSPTYMGSISAVFKQFMEDTSRFWYQQPWKDKLAAGFTNSSTTNGDKLNTLTDICLFAAQHSMIWISTGILPAFSQNRQLPTPNGMGSYLGLMTQSDGARQPGIPDDLETAELFGSRIAETAKKFIHS